MTIPLTGYDLAEQALIDWVLSVTGFPVGRVIAKNDKDTQPDLPYATVDLPVGQPTGDGSHSNVVRYDPTALAGQEIGLETSAHQETVVTVEVFTRATAGGIDKQGDHPSRYYVSLLAVGVFSQAARDILSPTGLVPIRVLNSVDLTMRQGAVGQGRSLVEILFRFVEIVTSPTGYIATADVTGTVS